jgi:hypothetical protein
VIRAIDNPFSVDRMMRVRFRPQGCSWDELMARLRTLNYRAAIVGPKGSGKTTLLEDLGSRLEAIGFSCIYSRCDVDDMWRRRPLGPREVLMLDGAERLTRLEWWRLKRMTRRGGGSIVTAHAATRVPTVIETGTSVALFDGLLRELSQPRPRETVERLFWRHGGNVREAMRELYDECTR